MLQLKGALFNLNQPTDDVGFSNSKGSSFVPFIDFLRRIEECKRSRAQVEGSLIVYVDSDLSNRELIRRHLEGLGHA